jgi:hypothetical protein
VSELVAITADPIIDVIPRAVAATRRWLKPADLQAIHQIVADLEAIKLAHKDHAQPAMNLARYQRAFCHIVNRLGLDIKCRSFKRHFNSIKDTLCPEDRPTCGRPFRRLIALHKYRTIEFKEYADPRISVRCDTAE